jgi:hypothetical protein
MTQPALLSFDFGGEFMAGLLQGVRAGHARPTVVKNPITEFLCGNNHRFFRLGNMARAANDDIRLARPSETHFNFRVHKGRLLAEKGDSYGKLCSAGRN